MIHFPEDALIMAPLIKATRLPYNTPSKLSNRNAGYSGNGYGSWAVLHGPNGIVERDESPLVLCSLGDGSITEGEVAEAFQMAVLKKLPIIYLVQDNDWGISATGKEMRAMDAYEYAAGFKGLQRMALDGSDFIDSYLGIRKAIDFVRKKRAPILVHAKCPLLGHHTSGVRKEWYRGDDLEEHKKNDPLVKLHAYLTEHDVGSKDLNRLSKKAADKVAEDFERALKSPDPLPADFDSFEFVPTPITEEKGIRTPVGAEKVVIVDAALHAVDEILSKHPEALFYGQDVGRRLGGVFREAATLARNMVITVSLTPLSRRHTLLGQRPG
jgi:2-oxoisovalerate dehydrogenase E1 component